MNKNNLVIVLIKESHDYSEDIHANIAANFEVAREYIKEFALGTYDLEVDTSDMWVGENWVDFGEFEAKICSSGFID